MTAPWTQTFSYLAYAVAIALALVNWVGEVVKDQLYSRAADGQLDERWLELAHWLAQYLRTFVFTGGVLALVGLLLAAVPAGEPAEVVSSHRAYLLRLAALAVAALCLSYVGHGDLSKLYIHYVALIVCVWALWKTLAGWNALSIGVAVAGPALWWLGLVLVSLVILRLILLLFFISPDSPYQF